MRKSLLILFSLMICLTSIAQKVDVTTDDFTGEKIVKTSWEKIYTGGATGKNQTRIQFKEEGGNQYVLFRVFTDRVVSIDKDAVVLFKTPNGLIKATVTKHFIADPGAWSPNPINNKLGIYFCASVDLSLFDAQIEKIRIPLSDGNLDLEIKQKESKKILEMVNLVQGAAK